MKKRYVVGSAIVLLLVALFALAAFATQAEIYLSSDKNGQTRVTNVHEGQEVWICVYDPDQNIDCDVRDKIWTDIKIMDPKTGAYIVWNSYDATGTHPHYKGHYPGNPGSTSYDYLEETGPNTGLFVSSRPFQIGTRKGYVKPINGAHTLPPADFQWGFYDYVNGVRGWFDCNGNFTKGLYGGAAGGGEQPPAPPGGGGGEQPPAPPQSMQVQPMQAGEAPTCGRFENMDTLVEMYQDPKDPRDVAVGMAKISDTTAKIAWGQEIYKDANSAATITVTDPDENLNSNAVEYVPVWIIVNPGSWNPIKPHSANSFCTLKRYGGVNPGTGAVLNKPIRWYNIYDSGIGANYPNNNQPQSPGAYYIQYPTPGSGNVTAFNTADPHGYARVMFYAQETGVNTGVFQLTLNSILKDLGFKSLNVGDVLVAYYIDPNDPDDFVLAPAYIESKDQISVTSFTDATRQPQTEFWLGRDAVYTQVIDSNANVDSCCPEQVVVNICDPHETDDSEWVILDETSSNSPVFFSNAGMQLLPVWDALGVGNPGPGGYQLQLDNWKLEAFNEDSVYARYNDVYYTAQSMKQLGDGNTQTAFPPTISRVRVANDVSFAQMKIADTQVYDGSKVNMYFLDRNGNRVSGYVSSDCVFVEVVDPDQNEDSYRRERISAYWDGGQNYPFGPMALNTWGCNYTRDKTDPVNPLLGDTNIFNNGNLPKLYVLNPRNGRWASIDLLETGVKSGDFVSVTCIDLTSVYTCVPTLGAKPGDTIIAVYQDPSNHSDSAWISIKVGMGGGTVPPSQHSSTTFADASGSPVTQYTDTDKVYVKVTDPSHAGAAQLLDAVKIDDKTFDLKPLAGAQNDTFITDAISMSAIGATAGSTITATYTDPTDPTDTSSATATVIASTLSITKFYVDPNPFSTTTTFSYEGTGTASTFSVSVYDLAGHLVWHKEAANVSEITWDGTANGVKLVSGPYVYVATLTGPAAGGTTKTFTYKGTVGIQR